jgi:hypothetical protein
MTGTIAGFTSTGIDDNATSTAITIDASENVGIGSAPESGTSGDVSELDMGLMSLSIWKGETQPNDSASYGYNCYKTSGFTYKAKKSSATEDFRPAVYEQAYGQHYFKVATTATADAAISWTTAMTIENTGDVTVGTGNLVIGTSGKGIDFSADGNAAGMTSEVLDDYEEGTWTPAIEFGGASVGVTYNTNGQTGTYTKVGNLVTAICFLYLTSKGTSVGSAAITGLPFTSNAALRTYNPAIFRLAKVSFVDVPHGYVPNNTSFIYMQEVTNAGNPSALTDADFTNTSDWMATVTYRV